MTLNARILLTGLLLAALALVPVVANLTGQPFLVTLFNRILILAIAAVSLDLILGFGGMVSFGHAVYIGIGGYVVGIAAHHGLYSAWVQWPLALALSALLALIIGSLCLRSRGIYFIMITLAFAQMVYFMAVGTNEYGGDDGLTIYSRSKFGGGFDLGDRTTFYYFCFACLTGCLYLTWRIVNSRFGMVLQGSRLNDGRMQALGVPTQRYRLVAFVISGAMCGLAGVLLANHTDFVSPALMHWTRSGDLIIMIVLGGMGTLVGPVAGTALFLVLEEVLSSITEYWQIVLGPVLVLMAVYKSGGLAGLLPRRGAGQ
jgi:branched-chain amino acid transport system permease protein